MNSALPEVMLRVKRLEALEKLGRRAERGEFDAAIAARDAERQARRRSGS
ncbi:hypothetical protein [Stackebrandtia albiflava]|nr:hypothetical protein [Stackebrandtia albiflava]